MAFTTLPFWLALAGVVTAYVFYMVVPSASRRPSPKVGAPRDVLENKYYMDWINENIVWPVARAGSAPASGRVVTPAP